MSIDINYVTKLARINVSDEQKTKLAKQLSDILAYIEKLKELDVANVEPMSHVLGLKNVFRKDETKTSLPLEKVLFNAPLKTKDSFTVPKVIE